MFSVQEVLEKISATSVHLGDEWVSIDKAEGRILREPVKADRDFPPYHRVTMDGIAIRYSGWANGLRSFRLAGTQFAGAEQQTLPSEDMCIEIMTGAVCPDGADTILRYEDLEFDRNASPAIAFIKTDEVQPGQNIHLKGSDRRAEDVLVEPGVKISAAEVAIASTVGMAKIKVALLPRIAILSTGDELVDVDETPQPHQIRRSNSYMLQAALRTMGIDATTQHLPDDLVIIEKALSNLLRAHDVLIVSGGVSKGKADHIPEILEKLGVSKIFHRVSQRPGKPFWFGHHSEDQKVVFALPGNPVSSFVGFHRYIRPWIFDQMGLDSKVEAYAQLSEAFTFLPELTYFLLVNAVTDQEGHFMARPVPGSGSGDLANLLNCNGFVELPAGRSHFDRGEVFPYFPYRF